MSDTILCNSDLYIRIEQMGGDVRMRTRGSIREGDEVRVECFATGRSTVLFVHKIHLVGMSTGELRFLRPGPSTSIYTLRRIRTHPRPSARLAQLDRAGSF